MYIRDFELMNLAGVGGESEGMLEAAGSTFHQDELGMECCELQCMLLDLQLNLVFLQFNSETNHRRCLVTLHLCYYLSELPILQCNLCCDLRGVMCLALLVVIGECLICTFIVTY